MISLDHKAVYLSGPMSELPDYNRAAFAQAEKELYALGAWYVFNPCEYWRADGNTLPDWSYADFMRADLHMLTSGTPGKRQFDLVVLLDGYASSRGARLEASVAEACNILSLTLAEIRKRQLKDFWEGK